MRIAPEPPAAEPPADDVAPMMSAESPAPSFELTGDQRAAFKEQLGHECKVGDTYDVVLTATAVSPNAIALEITSIEPGEGYEEQAAAEAPAAPSGKSPAMTYAS